MFLLINRKIETEEKADKIKRRGKNEKRSDGLSGFGYYTFRRMRIVRKYKCLVGHSMVYHKKALNNFFIPCHRK